MSWTVEHAGNRVPRSTIIFLAMSGIVIVLSYILHLFSGQPTG